MGGNVISNIAVAMCEEFSFLYLVLCLSIDFCHLRAVRALVIKLIRRGVCSNGCGVGPKGGELKRRAIMYVPDAVFHVSSCLFLLS